MLAGCNQQQDINEVENNTNVTVPSERVTESNVHIDWIDFIMLNGNMYEGDWDNNAFNGYDPGFRLAAKIPGGTAYRIYEVYGKPEAVIGEDILGIRNKAFSTYGL